MSDKVEVQSDNTTLLTRYRICGLDSRSSSSLLKFFGEFLVGLTNRNKLVVDDQEIHFA